MARRCHLACVFMCRETSCDRALREPNVWFEKSVRLSSSVTPLKISPTFVCFAPAGLMPDVGCMCQTKLCRTLILKGFGWFELHHLLWPVWKPNLWCHCVQGCCCWGSSPLVALCLSHHLKGAVHPKTYEENAPERAEPHQAGLLPAPIVENV